MPNTGSTKKQNVNSKNVSGTTNNNNNNNCNNNSGCSEKSPSSCTTVSGSRARKRKRCGVVKFSDCDLESELEDCNMEDALAIESKLRKVAKNNSLSDDEMRRLLQKFVKNEHILALVTLQAEDELAREREEAEQHAIIITDTPSVAKLTRSKAKELNKTPALSLPSLKTDAFPQTEIATFINEDLHSDEEDEDYTYREEELMSDDDPNTTASDFDSNPCTPQTPLTQTEAEDSPVKFTEDGCFKIPLDIRKDTEDLRIAARTRSKLCLQQTTIEDIQSKFVPPDVEQLDLHDMDLTAKDDDWMEFLNDFSKPMNNSIIVDDDDPINDPEYVAAEKVPIDAEELRDVNISKKELTELVAELFEGLLNENISMENIEVETPQKFIANNFDKDMLNTPQISPIISTKSPNEAVSSNTRLQTEERAFVTRTINFESPPAALKPANTCASEMILTSSNITTADYSNQQGIISTISTNMITATTVPTVPIPVAQNYYTDTESPCKTITVPQSAINTQHELIAVPLPGQPNCYKLAKVVPANHVTSVHETESKEDSKARAKDTRYTTPYDANFTWEYISIRRHVYSEYMERFENLRNIKPQSVPIVSDTDAGHNANGFTPYQHDLLQQQLRIHVQFLAQNFLQTYSHPDFWKLSTKPKEMLFELHNKAKDDASYRAWNLNDAVELVNKWEHDLSEDNQENRDMMSFIHREIELTNRNTRQIPRFAPRIIDRILDSKVFMYPQYLPRIPFTSKVLPFHVFSPAESYLLAIGLEKHFQYARDNKIRARGKHDPFDVACRCLSKDTVFGKSKRRIVDQLRRLQSEEYYNPVKYYFEHNCAPPMEQTLITFENNTVLTPRQRFEELPLGWQKYINEQNEVVENKKKSKATRKSTTAETRTPKSKTIPAKNVPETASERARLSYLEFVREAVGEDIQLPENLNVAAEPNESATAEPTETIRTPTKTYYTKKDKKDKFINGTVPKSLTINVNYVFGANIPTTTSSISGTTFAHNSTFNNNSQTTVRAGLSNSWAQLLGSTPNVLPPLPAPIPTPPIDSLTNAIDYTFDFTSNTLRPAASQILENSTEDLTQRKLTDYYDLEETQPSTNWADIDRRHATEKKVQGHKRLVRKNLLSIINRRTCLQITKNNKKSAKKYRSRRQLQKRCYELFTLYRYHLEMHNQCYKNVPLIQFIYRRFKALELYTNLLKRLSMFCRTATMNSNSGPSSNAANSPTSILKRTRTGIANQMPDDEVANAATRSKKANRQEEYLRQMLMPDTREESNRKDAIYAFNFYEKVEELLMSSNRPEDCKKFNMILKNFDPSRDKVADLYHKMEKLFLPDYPELAQVFLTFLLPSEAAEVGKFFEHFMITNATTFINKLNIYFNKQPAQIRKIYTCLNELAEDRDVNMKKVETKILPLLKGNQFLIDWFLQQFPGATPPERILPAPESINLKEVNNTQNGEFMENVTDLLDSPTQEQQSCQLRYINGRIFYGSKIVLPAKLSFMANYLTEESAADTVADFEIPATGCIHGIREQGEKRLAEATAAEANAAATDCNSDDNDKSEEEDASKALVIDTTGGEEDSCSSIETCDDATLRAHAMRLNPNYYSTAMFSNSVTSTPNPSSNLLQNHIHVRKAALNFNDDACGQGKLSPRKQGAADIRTLGLATSTNPQSACQSPNADLQNRDKRKSPTKKVKSPLCITATNTKPLQSRASLQPMVVIHEQSPTIACARKLKSLIDAESNDSTAEDGGDNKASISIVARAKHDVVMTTEDQSKNRQHEHELITKMENYDDLEYLPENAVIKMDMDSSSADELTAGSITSAATVRPNVVSQFDSDEDCKFDVVATLANDVDNAQTAVEQNAATNAANTTQTAALKQTSAKPSTAWTRDEDKIILIQMKLCSHNRELLFEQIQSKLQTRSLAEISARHQFLMEFLSKLQGR